MTQENQGTNSAVPDNLPVKRKRGRPRKDRSQTPAHVPATPDPDTENKNQRRRIEPVTDKKNDMVGQAVFGVLDGAFDAGYLLTVRVGDTNTILKGVVFQPGSSVPISGSNDVAPHVKMLRRAEIHIPQVNLPTHGHGHSVQHGQMSKRPDELPRTNEGSIQPMASPPVQASKIPTQSSVSQPQITDGMQDGKYVPQAANNTLYRTGEKAVNSANKLAALAAVCLPQAGHPESELKDEHNSTIEPPAKHIGTVKLEVLPETETPFRSEATRVNHLPHNGDHVIQSNKSVEAIPEGQTTVTAALLHTRTGPTTEPVKRAQENQTSQEVVPTAPYNPESVHATKQ